MTSKLYLFKLSARIIEQVDIPMFPPPSFIYNLKSILLLATKFIAVKRCVLQIAIPNQRILTITCTFDTGPDFTLCLIRFITPSFKTHDHQVVEPYPCSMNKETIRFCSVAFTSGEISLELLFEKLYEFRVLAADCPIFNVFTFGFGH
jgi:hypothetical protein